MSRADHPAGKGRRCAAIGCGQVAAASIAVPGGFAIIRPLSSEHASAGDLACLDHAHLAVDIMLMRATPEPA